MIILITAVPGSGKSLLAVQLIKDYIKNSNRKIYTNLPLSYSEPDHSKGNDPTHLIIDPSGQRVFPLPENDDWQLAEKGSVIIYDEAQQIFPATAKAGVVNDDRLTGLETHRHHGYDIYFITQDATFVHHHIRKLIGKHIHLYRGKGASIVGRYQWSHYCERPNDRFDQERAEFDTWRFPKELFPLYHSSVEHTHKFTMPKKAWYFIVLLSLLIIFVTYKLLNRDGEGLFLSGSDLENPFVVHSTTSSAVSSKDKPKKDVSESPVVKDLIDVFPDFERSYILSTAPKAVPLEGCISFADNCQCFDTDGFTLELSYEMCQDIMKKPLPRKLSFGRNSQPYKSNGG